MALEWEEKPVMNAYVNLERIQVDDKSYIEVWQSDYAPSSYPWKFSYTFNDATWFACGVPNYCISRHQAICRARTKLKQLISELEQR